MIRGAERVAPPPANDRLGWRVRPRLRPGGRCAAAKSPRRSIIPLRRNAEVDPDASLSAQHRAVVEAVAEGREIPGADACANRPASSISKSSSSSSAHSGSARSRSVAKRRPAPPTARRRRVHAPWRRLPSPPQTQKEEEEEEEEGEARSVAFAQARQTASSLCSPPSAAKKERVKRDRKKKGGGKPCL